MLLQWNFYQDKFEFPANFAAKASPKRAGPARTGSSPVLSQGQPLGFCFDFAFTENFSELESQKLIRNKKIRQNVVPRRLPRKYVIVNLHQFDGIFFYESTFFKEKPYLSLFQWLNTCQVNYVIDFLTCARWISLFKVSAIVCILRKLHMVSNNL